MQAWKSVILSIVLIATVLTPTVAAEADSRAGFVDAYGLYWSDDKRLTNDPSADTDPQLVVDSQGDSHVIWYRSGQYMYKKIDQNGKELTPAKSIATGVIPTEHSGQNGKSIGIDGLENFHVIWKTSSFGPVIYHKYNSAGKSLTGDIDASPGFSMSQGTNMAVGKNNYAYVIYDYYPPGSTEREGLTLIDAAGKIVKTGSDVSEPAWYIEGATLTIDYDNNVRSLQNVWSGADQGMWHSKLDKFGIRPAGVPPVHLYATGAVGFPPMPPMAATPDGNLHIMRSSAATGGGTLDYIELDLKGNIINGGDSAQIIITTTAADYGDVGGDTRNNAYVIWADSGDNKLYYEKVEPGKERASRKPAKVTSGFGTARDPKVAVDPNDNLHLVWRDNRDGNDEIYYKFALNFGVELGLAPEEAAKILFIHPREVKSGNFTVKNLGGLNDTVYLNLTTNYNGHEADGWDSWLAEDDCTEGTEKTLTIPLGPQQLKKLLICVRGPNLGLPNDWMGTNIEAKSEGNPFRNDTFTVKTFLVVDRRIEMTLADNVRIVDAGETTSYAIQITNAGDIFEDVVCTLEGPPDWDAQLDITFLEDMRPRDGSLSGESRTITLTVTAPKDSLAGEVGVVVVVCKAEDNAGVTDNVIANTIVAESLFVEIWLDESEQDVLPDRSEERV